MYVTRKIINCSRMFSTMGTLSVIKTACVLQFTSAVEALVPRLVSLGRSCYRLFPQVPLLMIGYPTNQLAV